MLTTLSNVEGKDLLSALFEFTKNIHDLDFDELIALYGALDILEATHKVTGLRRIFLGQNKIASSIAATKKVVKTAMKKRIADLNLGYSRSLINSLTNNTAIHIFKYEEVTGEKFAS